MRTTLFGEGAHASANQGTPRAWGLGKRRQAHASWMSAPMIATSVMTHSANRGTTGYSCLQQGQQGSHNPLLALTRVTYTEVKPVKRAGCFCTAAHNGRQSSQFETMLLCAGSNPCYSLPSASYSALALDDMHESYQKQVPCVPALLRQVEARHNPELGRQHLQQVPLWHAKRTNQHNPRQQLHCLRWSYMNPHVAALSMGWQHPAVPEATDSWQGLKDAAAPTVSRAWLRRHASRCR